MERKKIVTAWLPKQVKLQEEDKRCFVKDVELKLQMNYKSFVTSVENRCVLPERMGTGKREEVKNERAEGLLLN